MNLKLKKCKSAPTKPWMNTPHLQTLKKTPPYDEVINKSGEVKP
jgi:hypothetical protein